MQVVRQWLVDDALIAKEMQWTSAKSAAWSQQPACRAAIEYTTAIAAVGAWQQPPRGQSSRNASRRCSNRQPVSQPASQQ